MTRRRLSPSPTPARARRQPSPTRPLPPGEVTVKVLNAAGVAGLARKAADSLAALGFAISGAPANAPVSGQAESEVRYPASLEKQAKTLAAAVPGSKLVPDETVTTVTLYVGSDFGAAQATAAAPSASGSASATAGLPQRPRQHRAEDRRPDHVRELTLGRLLEPALRRDPSGPLLTWYDEAGGERVELSASTLDNWVAKTANLLDEELPGSPGVVGIRLPAHWQALVVALAAWRTGCSVVLGERRRP